MAPHCAMILEIAIFSASPGFKGQTISKANYGFLNSPKKRMKLTILSKKHHQGSEFRSFFWETLGINILLLRFADT